MSSSLQAIKISINNLILKPAVSNNGYSIDEDLLNKRIDAVTKIAFAFMASAFALHYLGVATTAAFVLLISGFVLASVPALERIRAKYFAHVNVVNDFKDHPFFNVYKKIHCEIQPPCKSQELFSDLTLPETVVISRDSKQRVFGLFSETMDDLDIRVINPGYGIFEFYDKGDKRKWINVEDNLYDNYGTLLAQTTVQSDKEWKFFNKNKSTLITVDTPFKNLHIETEYDPNQQCFAIRSIANSSLIPLATAQWTSNSTGESWAVKFIKPEETVPGEIPKGFMIWSLLKHSQKHLPSPDRCSYFKNNY